MRTEMLNNKYPENMKHELREHVSVTFGPAAALGLGLGLALG